MFIVQFRCFHRITGRSGNFFFALDRFSALYSLVVTWFFALQEEAEFTQDHSFVHFPIRNTSLLQIDIDSNAF